MDIFEYEYDGIRIQKIVLDFLARYVNPQTDFIVSNLLDEEDKPRRAEKRFLRFYRWIRDYNDRNHLSDNPLMAEKFTTYYEEEALSYIFVCAEKNPNREVVISNLKAGLQPIL